MARSLSEIQGLLFCHFCKPDNVSPQFTVETETESVKINFNLNNK